MRWRRWWHEKRGGLVIAKRKERSAVQQFWFGQETARDSGNWAVDHGRQGAAAPAATSTPVDGIVSKTLSLERDALKS
jgi:hypothetical protein